MIADRQRRDRGGAVLFLALLALAAALRFHGIGFGLPALNDPDELMFELGATRMLTSATLNPGWFGHPATITMYVLALVNSTVFGVGWLLGFFTDPTGFLQAIYKDPGIVILPGRIAMAVFALATIWQVWRMGRDLAGPLAGLLAALLLALSPVHITYSQIIRSDMVGTVFMLMTVSAALRIARDGKAADYGWAALGLALAVASKWPFAIAGIAVAGAVCVRIREDRFPSAEWRKFGGFLLLAPLFLLTISPYLLLDYETVVRNLSGEARTQHLGATGGGFLDNGWWYLSGPLINGLGLAGFLLAAGGVVLFARRRTIGWVILPVLVGQILIICLPSLRWERWILPMLPLLALAAGFAGAAITRTVSERWPSPGPARVATGLLVAAPFLLLPAAWANAEARTHDTRQAATRWATKHIPPGSVVMVEHFAFDLVSQPWTVTFPMGDAGCIDAKALLDGKTDYRMIEAARGNRSNVDYGTMAAARRESCRADYMILMEMERYRNERQRFPAQYAAYAALLNDMDVQVVFRPQPGKRAGPVMIVLAAKPATN